MQINLPILSHAVLVTELEGSYFNLFLQKYIKNIVCNAKVNNSFCDTCLYCVKVNTNTYFDLIVVDGGKQIISKNQIIEIQNKFLTTGLEHCNQKIYVLKQIENTYPQGINALLKFLEDPPRNTYAILTTRNEQTVPLTIRSRCQHFFLKKINFDWSTIITNNNLKKTHIKILQNLYWTIDEAIEAISDKSFFELSEIGSKLLKAKKSLSEISFLFEKFKKLSYLQIRRLLKFIIKNLKISCWEKLINLNNDIGLNPIRSSIFWQIIQEIEKCKRHE